MHKRAFSFILTLAAGSALGHAPAAVAQTQAATPLAAADQFLWLENVSSDRSMAWVNAENAKTTAVLERDPHYASLYADALQLAAARDRIAYPSVVGGRIYNLWQDATHAHGLWRRTTVVGYRAESPAWRTVLDLDSLSSVEHANWFMRGSTCAEPAETRCLLDLSDGGEDAVTVREFDLAAGRFVNGGFVLPRGKQSVAWENDSTLLVAREWKPGEMTHSGYAFVVKRVKRGEPLSAATEVFRGSATDVSVNPFRLDDGDGHHAVFLSRGVDFFGSEVYVETPGGFARLGLPLKSSVSGLVDGRLVVSLDTAWTSPAGSAFTAGSLVALPLADVIAHPATLEPTLVAAPGPRESINGVGVTRHALVVTQLDNVRGRAYVYVPAAKGTWTRTRLNLPDNVSIALTDADSHSDLAYISVSGFLTPSSVWTVNASTHAVARVKSLPAKFDAARDTVEQFETASSDGTQIPYFVVHPKGMALDGHAPTILYAYGGFQISETPSYSSTIGKLWLEKGGVYALANIRGGGEFGPAWHEAGLKTHRQLVYDDFAAVGRDLVRRGITSAPHLGIQGGSNGGLLMGVELTQHPEMWGAVDIQVPLLDMMRYEQIEAGASWVAEYGSVSNPDERAFLASISPYQNLRPGVAYPEPLIWTTTKDDRVGPEHARKFAAKMSSMNLPYLFYEVTEGGHGSGASVQERAHTTALEMTYFTRQLMAGGSVNPRGATP